MKDKWEWEESRNEKYSKILFLITAVTMISSCTVAPLTGRRQLKLVSDESVAESSISSYRELIQQAGAKGLLANNTPDGQRLRRIGGRMSAAVEKYLNENGMSKKISGLQWEFNLIKTKEINAFAMPGGKIAFYTGIMPVLNSDSGIAFVMGHEIGHVIGGHHAEASSNNALAGIAAGVTDALTGGNIISSLVSDGLSITLLKFNRTQEYEADKYGMIFMAMAGYNPSEAITALERMDSIGGSQGAEILSTHPSGKNRIEAARKFLPEAMKYYNAK